MTGDNPRILLVIGGGIAAYKACELVRLIRKGGGDVTCAMTESAKQFVTPMALAALSENPVRTSLWDTESEALMGHIQLSRSADLVVVCPATANLLAKMAAGIADDLASTLILATNKPVMAVPAMNVRMWEHEATRRNIAWLRQAGVEVLDPDQGIMACGEFGYGRLPEPEAIWAAIAERLGLAIEAAGVTTRAQAKRAPRLAADEIEALEPEEEIGEVQQDPDEQEESGAGPARKGGLAGLLASIIPRTTPKRTAEEIEAQLLADAQAAPVGVSADEGEGDHRDEGAMDSADLVGDEAAGTQPAPTEPGPALDAGPILARKGAARSAPPTDPAAINHLVRTGAMPVPPEPLGDAGLASVDERLLVAPEALVGDALDGRPLAADPAHRPLEGRHVLVTAGPTWEAIDPVRYIANRSSGKQGFAIAAAAAALGARVTLIAGPVMLRTPPGVERVDVESAEQMAEAVRAALPADAAIMVAAVADWKPKEYRGEKMKKRGSAPPALVLVENPDILANLASSPNRPGLVVGFAAETEDVIDNAKRKRKRKAADWIIANDVSGGVMGGDRNRVHIVSTEGVVSLEEMPKLDVALALMERIAQELAKRAENG